MNKEQLRIALRLRQKAEKLVANLDERLAQVQAAEDEDADLMNRPAREMKVEPLIEVPTPLLAAVLEDLPAEVPAEVAGHVAAYRRHCRFMKGLGHTNVVAEQLLAVLDAAGVAPPEDAEEPPIPTEKVPGA